MDVHKQMTGVQANPDEVKRLRDGMKSRARELGCGRGRGFTPRPYGISICSLCGLDAH